MYSLFEELDWLDQKTLVIIGNGFDIASGIKSRYRDFKEWLEETNRQNLVGALETFFCNQQDLWCDIEKSLGKYDENQILEYCRPQKEIDYDHPTRSIAAIEDSPDTFFRPVLDEFIEAFSDWVENIDITSAEKRCDLSRLPKYLTFNYTETLEKIYGIPEAKILHIHGSRISDSHYIVGHNNLRNPNEVDDDSQMPFILDTWSKIIIWMNEMVKNAESIIRKHQDFFNNLFGIERVVVYGHSFGEIDWPYMDEIIKQIGNDKTWSVSYHTCGDLKQIESFFKTRVLDNFKVFRW